MRLFHCYVLADSCVIIFFLSWPISCRLLFLFVPQRLELLDGYLKEFDAAQADRTGSKVQWQQKKDAPWRVTEEFPAGEDSKGRCLFVGDDLMIDVMMNRTTLI